MSLHVAFHYRSFCSYKALSEQELKNNDPKPKFSGSYKKKKSKGVSAVSKITVYCRVIFFTPNS